MIADGGKIQYTQAAVNLEELLGKFIFNGDDKNKTGKDSAAPAAATDAPPAATTTPGDAAEPFGDDY